MGRSIKMTVKIPSVIVVDNFYNNPQEVLALANSISYAKAPQSNYPGERTLNLADVAPEYFEMWKKKFLEYFGACNPYGDDAWEFSTQFQRITASVDNPALNEGWVHMDGGQDIGGVIYLNEQPHRESGTIIASPKNGLRPDPNGGLSFRNAFYGNRNQVTEAEFLRAKEIHNAKFENDISVTNQFNRMMAFNCRLPHRQNGFGALNDQRLTQVFFAKIKQKEN